MLVVMIIPNDFNIGNSSFYIFSSKDILIQDFIVSPSHSNLNTLLHLCHLFNKLFLKICCRVKSTCRLFVCQFSLCNLIKQSYHLVDLDYAVSNTCCLPLHLSVAEVEEGSANWTIFCEDLPKHESTLKNFSQWSFIKFFIFLRIIIFNCVLFFHIGGSTFLSLFFSFFFFPFLSYEYDLSTNKSSVLSFPSSLLVDESNTTLSSEKLEEIPFRSLDLLFPLQSPTCYFLS